VSTCDVPRGTRRTASALVDSGAPGRSAAGWRTAGGLRIAPRRRRCGSIGPSGLVVLGETQVRRGQAEGGRRSDRTSPAGPKPYGRSRRDYPRPAAPRVWEVPAAQPLRAPAPLTSRRAGAGWRIRLLPSPGRAGGGGRGPNRTVRTPGGPEARCGRAGWGARAGGRVRAPAMSASRGRGAPRPDPRVDCSSRPTGMAPAAPILVHFLGFAVSEGRPPRRWASMAGAPPARKAASHRSRGSRGFPGRPGICSKPLPASRRRRGARARAGTTCTEGRASGAGQRRLAGLVRAEVAGSWGRLAVPSGQCGRQLGGGAGRR
jgi:hypothetical protein